MHRIDRFYSYSLGICQWFWNSFVGVNRYKAQPQRELWVCLKYMYQEGYKMDGDDS